MAVIQLNDFSGGLNLLDDPAPNEAIDMLNVEVDRQGRVQKRTGYVKDGSMSAFAANASRLFYSTTLSQFVVQEGVNVRKRTGAATYALVKAFSNSNPVTFADFNGKLLMLHITDGLFSYTSGGTLTGPLGPGGPTIKGPALAIWQNKVWAALTSSVRLAFSAPGDETNWTTAGAGSVDIREVSDATLLALAVSPRVGLLAFKQNTSYRVIDSTTGSYVTIDPTTGASAQQTVAASDEYVISASGPQATDGFYVSDGMSPFQLVSQKVGPLFERGEMQGIYVSTVQDRKGTRFFISNTVRSLEFRPDSGAIWMRSHPVSAVATSGGGTSWMFVTGADPYVFQTGTSPGTDDGAAITSRFQTPWFPLEGMHSARLQHVICKSRGDFSLYARKDRETSGGTLMAVDGVATALGTQQFWPRKLVREVSFRIEESSSLATGSEPNLYAGGVGPLGAFALHSLTADVSPLGMA